MQANQIPTLVPLAFAANGTKNVIPEASQITITPGAASLNDGFPPLTFTPVAAGGVPPAGGDFNGILNLITQSIRWSHGGGRYAFSATFAADANVTGYPQGAELLSADLQGTWISLNDSNTDNPDTGAGTKWVPGRAYGVTPITGLTNANVTLTPAQAAKSKITLAGALTANVQIIFPVWTKEWEVVNNTTGAFTITAKTAAGTGVALPAGQTKITGDGTNIVQPAESIAPATLPTQPAQLGQMIGRLLNVQTFTASGTYTPTPGTNKVRVTIVGGGGAGGGASTTTSGQVSAGAGGSSGSSVIALLTTGFSGVAVTIGAGGTGNAGGTGITGGTSSFGAILSAPGGFGGAATNSATTSTSIASPGNVAVAPTVGAGLISSSRGSAGTVGLCLSANTLSGAGGPSLLGGGGGVTGNGSGNAAGSPGAGGGGAAAIPSVGTAMAGGSGGAGICIVEEFS